MVRNLLTFCTLLLLAAPAKAADWVSLPAAGSADQYFYDRSKLTIKDEEISYWKKVVFNQPQLLRGREATTGMLRERIHCSDHTAKLVSYLYYSASGETVDYVVHDEAEPTPIVPDTVGDAYERALCPMVWHKQEEARLKAEQKAADAELAASRKAAVKLEPETVKVLPVQAPTPPAAPVVPAATIQRKLQDGETAPSTRTTEPLPLPQIIEQLY